MVEKSRIPKQVRGVSLEKKFFYLVQGTKSNVSKYNFLQSDSANLVTLTYDEDFAADEVLWMQNIFLPNSTWAQGRNTLLEAVKFQNAEYFVFLDDDAELTAGSFGLFEKLLLEYRPDIGLPLTDVIRDSHRYLHNVKMQRPVGLDQIMQAYSRRALDEAIAIPFVTDFDELGWWISCEINQFLVLSAYGDRTIQFNEIEVFNRGHALDFPEVNNPLSNYISGDPSQNALIAKQYIIDKYGPQRSLVNSLFHDSRLPKYIYGPSVKTELQGFFLSVKNREFLPAIQGLTTLLHRLAINSVTLIFNSKNLRRQRFVSPVERRLAD